MVHVTVLDSQRRQCLMFVWFYPPPPPPFQYHQQVEMWSYPLKCWGHRHQLERGNRMAGMDLQMPWEYYVCLNCLQSNWYAIWLVKQQCLEPHRHTQNKLVPVVIDKSNMALVAIRPLPVHCNRFREKFVMCMQYPDCSAGDECCSAHSEVEMDTWNFKKSLITGTVTCCAWLQLWKG